MRNNLFISVLLLIFFVFVQPLSCADSLENEWNRFAELSKVWCTRLSTAPRGTIPAQSYQDWKELKAQWRVVERDFNTYYREK